MPYTNLPARVSYNPNSHYIVEYRTKQPKPYSLAAPYSFKRALIISRWGSRRNRDPSTNWSPEERPDVSSVSSFAYNKAYARFVAKIGDKSSFGATLTAERRETYGMIRGFVVKLYLSTRAARRGDYLGVLHELNFNPPMVRRTRVIQGKRRKVRVRTEYYVMPNGRNVAKGAASSWLLWSYGVSPLLSDIHNATEIFIRSTPSGVPVHAAATEPVKVHSYNKNGGTIQVTTMNGSIRIGIDATVVCENYDLWLLNQLGLVNPLQFVNEAVPFSFVIDWASNWSQVINSLTDFYGLRFTRSSVSTKREIVETYTTYPEFPSKQNESYSGGFSTNHFFFGRSLGIVRPTLRFRYERFEWQRALNAISLLIGFLPKSHKN